MLGTHSSISKVQATEGRHFNPDVVYLPEFDHSKRIIIHENVLFNNCDSYSEIHY